MSAVFRRASLPPLDLLAWPALAALAVLLSRLTDIDMSLSLQFFDPVTQSFPLRNHWLAKDVLHGDLKHLSSTAWLVLLVLTGHAFWRRQPARWQPLLFILVTSMLAISLNGWLKHLSSHSCPWSLAGLGGSAEYFRMLATVPADAGPGQCLPSGHAGNGFMWLAAVYACARWRRDWLLPVAAIVLGFALLCAGTQIVRGAHFLSHVLMSAAICGGVSSLAHHLAPRLRRPRWLAHARLASN